jgi:hypothetical protein
MFVRPARTTDAAAIHALYQALVPGDRNIHVSAERITQLEQDPHNTLLVVELEGAVCGTAFLTICLDPMSFGPGRRQAISSRHGVAGGTAGVGNNSAKFCAVSGGAPFVGASV